MPVTAKLSREFYEKFGDKITDEFVNWFNQVDATYRTEFKDLFEAHFSRLEAKLEQRLAQFESKFEQRLAQIETKFEQRLAQVEAKLEQRLAPFEAKFDAKLAELRAEVAVKIEQLSAGLDRRLAEQTRWLFGAWAVVFAAVIGLWFRR